MPLHRGGGGSFAEDIDKVHGRLEQRSISVLTPPKGLVNNPGVSQIARVTRDREPPRKGPDDAGKGEKDHAETVYLITSLDARAASPEELLRLNRGHWSVKNLNHRQRDCVCGEDACLTRTGNGPANRASLNNIAFAVIFANRREMESLADTRRRPQLNRSEAIAALARPRDATAPGTRRKAARHPERIIRGRKRSRRRHTGGPAATEPGQNMRIRPPFGGLPKYQPQRGKVLGFKGVECLPTRRHRNLPCPSGLRDSGCRGPCPPRGVVTRRAAA